MEDKQFLVDMGNRIASRRRELQFTQERLAEEVGISLQSISCIELGKKAIRPQNLLRLCRALDVSSDYILKGEKSLCQIEGLMKKISTLKEEDYRLVESLVNRLKRK